MSSSKKSSPTKRPVRNLNASAESNSTLYGSQVNTGKNVKVIRRQTMKPDASSKLVKISQDDEHPSGMNSQESIAQKQSPRLVTQDENVREDNSSEEDEEEEDEVDDNLQSPGSGNAKDTKTDWFDELSKPN